MIRWIRYSADSIFRSKRMQMFVITYVAYATLYSTRKPFSVVKKEVETSLQISTQWLGLVDTAFLGAYAVGQLLIPAVLSTHGSLSAGAVLGCLYGGSGVSSFLFGISSEAWCLCLLWMLNGLLHAAVFPLLVTVLSVWYAADERGKVMGAWTTSQQTGAIVATALSACVAARFGWRTAFILPGIFTAAFGVFLAWSLASTKADGSRPDTHPAIELVPHEFSQHDLNTHDLSVHVSPKSHPAGAILISIDEASPRDLKVVHTEPYCPVSTASVRQNASCVSISKITDVKSVSASYFCVKCIRYSLLFWLPYYLATELKYSHEIAGYTSIIFDLGGVVGGIGAGQLADRLFSGRRIFVAACACLLATLSLLAFSWLADANTFFTLFLLAIIGVAIAAADSIIGASAASDICDRANSAPSTVPAVSGVINGCGSVGAVLQGYLTSRISEMVGWPGFYGILAGVSLVGSGFLIVPSLNEQTYYRAAP